MTTALIIAIIAGIIFVAILIEYWLKRGKPKRPLAVRMKQGMPETSETKKPLGMEATDLDIVERAQKTSEIAERKSKQVKFR